jgi:hypothetical protein
MDDPMIVKVRDCTQEAPNDAGGLCFHVGIARVKIPSTAKLQDDEQAAMIIEGFKGLHDVRVVQLLQNRHWKDNYMKEQKNEFRF